MGEDLFSYATRLHFSNICSWQVEVVKDKFGASHDMVAVSGGLIGVKACKACCILALARSSSLSCQI